ncbi:hypothetical protein vseg_003888 [Gypsophila vaccaria]
MSLGKSLSTATTSSSSLNSIILNHNNNNNHTLISSKSSPLTVNYPHNHPTNHALLSLSSRPLSSTTPVSCKSSLGPGDGDSRTVLDAFFLGKALGEALTERVESVVGELLSTVGRLQAEQQKQIQDFQEDVLERAKTAKEKAAREALQVQSRATLSPTPGTKDVAVATSSAVRQPNGSGTSSVLATTPEAESPTSIVDEDSEDRDSLSSIPINE